MKYKNLNSGIVMDFPCELKGGGWVPVKVEKPRASHPAPAPKQEEVKKAVPRKRGKKLQ